MVNALEAISRLKEELDSLRPLPPDVLAQVVQKLRLESNYNSNALEGNTLTLGETRSLILHGLTAHGKPLRDHLDIQGHDSAVQAIEAAVRDDQELNGVFIRNLHRVLLKEPYETEAMTPDGKRVRRRISLGDYKSTPNNVVTSTGETYFFTPPEQVKQAVTDLLDWYRTKECEGEHPIIIAATFHYRFVRIHPFDDGNGRMARLLMNMILIKHGYTVAMIPLEERDDYLSTLEQADKTEDLTEFINYIANCCKYALTLHLKAARGEPIDDIEDIDKEIVLFKQSLVSRQDQVFSARAYVESVLSPFYEYCAGKLWRISDAFSRAHAEVKFTGTDADGNAVQGRVTVVREDSPSFESMLFPEDLPDQFGSLSTSITMGLYNFRTRQSESIDLLVENSTDAHQCRWRFSSDTTAVRWDYEGRELEDLKRQFNWLLRELMNTLRQE